ncbi:hypothetical protein [Pseudoxanthomonas sp. LARHCG66]
MSIAFFMSKAFPEAGTFGLGSFQVAVNGLWFGVKGEDATLLACSRDEMERRVRSRGSHTAEYAESSAEDVAKAYLLAVFGSESVLPLQKMEREAFLDSLFKKSIPWAPDGDEAFDDGSVILQFDIGECVRLIAFRHGDGGLFDLSDVTLSSAGYYACLQRACDEMLSWRTRLLQKQGNRLG